MSAPPKSSRAELAQFLNDLDSLGGDGQTPPQASSENPAPAPTQSPKPQVSVAPPSDGPAQEQQQQPQAQAGTNAQDAQDAMDFLDELSQRRSQTPVTVNRRSLDARPSSRASASSRPEASSSSTSQPAEQPANTSGGWGWSSVWTSASTAIQHAKERAEENIASISQQAGAAGLVGDIPTDGEAARKWTEHMIGYVKQHAAAAGGVDVEKLRESGVKAFGDILNAVAPPIAEHTVVQVYLSHDMLGYEGVETLVYRALAKVMEQVEGGELHVNSGAAEKPAQSSSQISDDERNLNTVSGLQEGHKLARANVDSLIKANASSSHAQQQEKKKQGSDLPITICPVYLRIQPVLAPLPCIAPDDSESSNSKKEQLSFIMILRDAEHNLELTTMSQCLPAAWLDIPFEQNEWVENEMVDVIRKATETVGQDWLRTRQFGQAHAVKEAAQKLQADRAAAAQQQQETAPAEAHAQDAGKNGSA